MSRAYDISDFAAFLRKYGNSGRDSESRSEKPSRDASQRTRPDRGRNQESRLSRNGYDRSRTIYRSRNREYSLRESEVQTLKEYSRLRLRVLLEGLDFRFPQGVLAVATAVNRSRARVL